MREAVGDGFHIMIDANQGFPGRRGDSARALLADHGIAWFEEPLPADDMTAMSGWPPPAACRSPWAKASTRPATSASTCAHGACSIVQVDVARIGGITPWLKVAHMAEALQHAVCPHFLMELHVSLVCAVPNGWMLEYIPQLDEITTSRLDIRDGHGPPARRRRGSGIAWDGEAITAGTVAGSHAHHHGGMTMQRMGMVLGLKADKVEDYKRLHAAVWPEVLAKITDCNIRNYSIYLKEPENLLFGYFEYHGTDFDADMAEDGRRSPDAGMVGGLHAAARSRSRPGRRANGGPTMEEVFHHD